MLKFVGSGEGCWKLSLVWEGEERLKRLLKGCLRLLDATTPIPHKKLERTQS